MHFTKIMETFFWPGNFRLFTFNQLPYKSLNRYHCFNSIQPSGQNPLKSLSHITRNKNSLLGWWLLLLSKSSYRERKCFHNRLIETFRLLQVESGQLSKPIPIQCNQNKNFQRKTNPCPNEVIKIYRLSDSFLHLTVSGSPLMKCCSQSIIQRTRKCYDFQRWYREGWHKTNVSLSSTLETTVRHTNTQHQHQQQQQSNQIDWW